MLSFRNLHSTKGGTKSTVLSVQNIIETYDFNGLKEDVSVKNRKIHPLYVNYILKDIKTRLVVNRTLIKQPPAKVSDKTECTCDVNGNHKVTTDPKDSTESNPDVQQNKNKTPLRLSQFISEKSEQVLSSDNHVPLFDNNYLMSYADFLQKFYVKNNLHRAKLKSMHLSKVSHRTFSKCYLCNMTFGSKLALAKHRSICTSKKEKRLIVKTFAQKLINKVKQTKQKNKMILKQNITPKEKKPRVLFHCNKCTDQFLYQSSLDAHLKFDHRPRPTCSLCNKMFDCRRKLLEHEENCAGLQDGEPSKKQTLGVIDFKAKTEIHICIKCENPFPTNNELRQHKLILNKRNPIDIEISKNDASMESVQNFEIFVKKNPVYSIIRQPNPYIGNDCSRCGKLFNNEKRLRQHESFCHEKTLRACPFCLKLFRGSYQRNQHLGFCSEGKTNQIVSNTVKVAPTEPMKYNCHCGLAFDTFTRLDDHLQSKHQQFFCMDCEQTYNQNVVKYYGVHFCIFTQSTAYSSPSNIPSHEQCSLCFEKIILRPFDRPTKHSCKAELPILQEVTKVIKPRRKHVCSQCHKLFKSRKKLLMHKKRLHNKPLQQKTLQQLHSCPFCEKTFLQSANYVRHMQLRHNKRCCSNCLHVYSHWNQVHYCITTVQKEISVARASKNSRAIQKNIKNLSTNLYCCYLCAKDCNNLESLVEHLACIHSHLNPYECTQCDYKAKISTCVEKHSLSTHDLQVNLSHKISELQKLHNIMYCNCCQTYYLNQKSVGEHICNIHVTFKSDDDCKHTIEIVNNSNSSKLKDSLSSPSASSCTSCFKPLNDLEISTCQNSETEYLCTNCNLYLPLYIDQMSASSSPLDFIPRPIILLPSELSSISKNNTTTHKQLITCEYCLRKFSSQKVLLTHHKFCERKLNGVVSVGPSLESCLNFTTDVNLETTTPNNDVMSLEDAEESLMSLMINENKANEQCKNSTNTDDTENSANIEHTANSASMDDTKNSVNTDHTDNSTNMCYTSTDLNENSATANKQLDAPLSIIDLLVLQDNIPLIKCCPLEDQLIVPKTNSTMTTVKKKRGRPRKKKKYNSSTKSLSKDLLENDNQRSKYSRKCKSPKEKTLIVLTDSDSGSDTVYMQKKSDTAINKEMKDTVMDYDVLVTKNESLQTFITPYKTSIVLTDSDSDSKITRQKKSDTAIIKEMKDAIVDQHHDQDHQVVTKNKSLQKCITPDKTSKYYEPKDESNSLSVTETCNTVEKKRKKTGKNLQTTSPESSHHEYNKAYSITAECIDNSPPFKIIEAYQLFPCKICNVNFNSKGSLRLHNKNAHAPLIKNENPNKTRSSKKRKSLSNDNSDDISDVKISNVHSPMMELTYSPAAKRLHVAIDLTSYSSDISSTITTQQDELASQPSDISSAITIQQDKLASQPSDISSTITIQQDTIPPTIDLTSADIDAKIDATSNSSEEKNLDNGNSSQILIHTATERIDLKNQSKDLEEVSFEKRKPEKVLLARETEKTKKPNVIQRNEKEKCEKLFKAEKSSKDTINKKVSSPTNSYAKKYEHKLNGSYEKSKLKRKQQLKAAKPYRKLKPHEKEKAILKNMVEKAKERKQKHRTKDPTPKIVNTKTVEKGISPTIGSEYSNGISNYFADIMLKSSAKRNQRKSSDYLNVMKNRLQKQFESNSNGQPFSEQNHAESKRKQQKKHLVDRGSLVLNPANVTGNDKPDLLSVRASSKSRLKTITSNLNKAFSDSKKIEEMKKTKLLFNPKNLDELRLKVRRKSIEMINKTTNPDLIGGDKEENIDKTIDMKSDETISTDDNCSGSSAVKSDTLNGIVPNGDVSNIKVRNRDAPNGDATNSDVPNRDVPNADVFNHVSKSTYNSIDVVSNHKSKVVQNEIHEQIEKGITSPKPKDGRDAKDGFDFLHDY